MVIDFNIKICKIWSIFLDENDEIKYCLFKSIKNTYGHLDISSGRKEYILYDQMFQVEV